MSIFKPAINSFNSYGAVMSLFVSRCSNACMEMCVSEVCYLAVHDEVADAAGEVFVLKLRVDVRDVLIHTAELEYVAHVQVSKARKGMNAAIRARSTHHTVTAISMSYSNDMACLENQISLELNM